MHALLNILQTIPHKYQLDAYIYNFEGCKNV